MDSPADASRLDAPAATNADSMFTGRPRWLMPAIWALLGIGLLAALWSASLRLSADAAYRDVIVLVDWHELSSLAEPPPTQTGATGDAAPARLSETPLAEELIRERVAEIRVQGRGGAQAGPEGIGQLPQRSQGLQLSGLAGRELPWRLMEQLPGAYLCYGEETLGTLLESGILRRAESAAPAPVYEVALARYTGDILRGAARHGYPVELPRESGARLRLQLPALPDMDMPFLPVCWRQDVIMQARQRNIPLLLRPGGSEFMAADGIARTLEFCKDQPLVLFQGTQVMGYPSAMDEVAAALRERGQMYGWVEFDKQLGGPQLAERCAPDSLVRVHSIPPEEMLNYNVSGAVERFMRALRERSIRVLYVRPFVRGKVIGASGSSYSEQLARVNSDYFAALKVGLEQHGLRIAARVDAPQSGPGRWLRLPIALGATGAVLWLLALWFPAIPLRYWSLLLGTGLLGSLAVLASSVAYSAVLLLAAIVFPLLGLWLGWTLYQRRTAHEAPYCYRRLPWALAALLLASLCSAVGGLLIHAGMWDASTILKIGEFRGVTPSLALPVLLLAAYAWQAETLQDSYDAARRRLAGYWQRLLTLWTSPIRYGDVAFILIALGALGIVVLRSGNDGPLGPLSIEMLFRGGLEETFGLRPRTKELLGHPLLVLFFLSLPWRNRVGVMFALAGLLGQVSILNTFCHLHTPLLLTAQRVGLGLLLGAATALLWGGLALLGVWLWERLRGGTPARGL